VGYRVVEVADERVPAALPASHSARQRSRPEPAQPPAAPLGYRVIQVAEEISPRPPRAASPSRRTGSGPLPRPPEPLSLGRPIAAGGLILVGLILGAVVVSLQGPACIMPPPAGCVEQAGDQVQVPEALQVIIPEEPATAAPPAEEKCPPRESGCLADIGRPAGKPGDAAGGRETFGTAVQFARNPREAARIAAAEGKLTFLLHVSGNFEEERFT
jgi:hypothetical protein